MTTIKLWPFEFVEFETGRLAGREYVRGGPDMYDEVEQRAALHARVRGVEIDVLGCAVQSSGAIAWRDRLGLRVRPS